MNLGPFRLVEQLGRGGAAQVWSAEREGTAEQVAIKVFSAPMYRDPRYRSAFRNEVRAAASLEHAHIVSVLDQGEVAEGDAFEAGMPWLAMDLLDGGPLTTRCGRMAWSEVRAVLSALLDALAHAHARGVIHRDLKPGNVLLGASRPAIKLTDFGLAHALDRQPEGTVPAEAGTRSYMAPEQFVGEWRDFGPWTDLYALGCLGWALVCGRPPFKYDRWMDAMRAHLSRRPPPLRPRIPIPPGFEEWLLRLLEKDPRDRFSCAADAAWALEALTDVGPAATLPEDAAVRAIPRALAPCTIAFGEGALPSPPERWESPEPPRLPSSSLTLFGLRAIPMVHRWAEREALWRALLGVGADGKPDAVLLVGPAGCGKSRLAEWLCVRAAEVGAAHVLRGSGEAVEPLLVRWLRADGLGTFDLRYRIEIALRSWGEPDPQEVSELVEMLAPWCAPEGEQVGVADALRRRAVLRLLGHLSTDRPVVVWLDDVSPGDESLDLVEATLREPLPVLFLLTRREPAEGTIGLGRPLEVRPLPDEGIAELVGRLADLEPDLVDQVVRRAEGNPLFAVQLLGDWIQRDQLVAGREGRRLRADARAALPDDLHALWSDRLDRLLADHPQDRVALEVAAALGVHVDPSEWAEACAIARVEPRPDLPERMVEQRLAIVSPDVPGWTFAHGMLRESVERLARAAGRYARHHATCVEVLRRRSGPRVAERLGRHLFEAGEAEAAIDLLLHGVRLRLADEDAVSARALLVEVDRAIAAARVPGSDRRRVEAFLERGRVELAEGRPEVAARWAGMVVRAGELCGWADLSDGGAELLERCGVPTD